QLGDIGCDPSRFISAEQLGRCWLPCILVIDMRERLPSAILDDEASEVIFNDPWWREAMSGGHGAAPIRVHQTAQRINARRITVIISKLTTVIIKYETVVTKSRSVIAPTPSQSLRINSGSLAMFDAMRLASSLDSNFAAERRSGSFE